MKNMNLERLLLSLFKEDFDRNKKFSYISQLTVITIKSLMPMMDEQAVRIDYTRFLEELKLWINYRIGENSSLLSIHGRVDADIYWNGIDDSTISRIIPLILANREYRVMEDEIIKNIIFTTGNLKILFESITIAYLLYLTLENEENIVDKLKQNIIGFSQVEFMDKYEQYFKASTKDYAGNFKVVFERERIHLLNTLNGIRNNRFTYLEDSINVLDKMQPETFIGNILHDYLYTPGTDYNLPRFYINLGEYIIKLRKSRVDPIQLQMGEYILPDVFSFDEGETFFHSLLRESKIIKKEVKGNNLTSLVQAKTGMYLFKR